LVDPDEKLADAPNDPAPAASDGGSSVAGSGGAEAPSAAAEPLYDVQREGFDPAPAGRGAGRAGIAWSIEGPVGSRRVVRKVLPESPSWVSERGLELAVQIRFQILENGTVKPGALIRRTSGFPEIDRRALEALKAWRFETIPGMKNPGAWGSVTFRFLLS
jgi:TonB family protein